MQTHVNVFDTTRSYLSYAVAVNLSTNFTGISPIASVICGDSYSIWQFVSHSEDELIQRFIQDQVFAVCSRD